MTSAQSADMRLEKQREASLRQICADSYRRLQAAIKPE